MSAAWAAQGLYLYNNFESCVKLVMGCSFPSTALQRVESFKYPLRIIS